MLINETHFRPIDTPKMANYRVYHNIRRGRPGGGTAIYVKRNIDHQLLPLPDPLLLETTGISINLEGGGSIHLYAVYNPPARVLPVDDLEALLRTNQPVIIAGDLNSKHPAWNSRATNRNGKLLHGLQNTNNILVVGPDEPTHYGTVGRPDVLDVAIIKNVTQFFTLDVLDELSSDHNPLALHLGDDHDEEPAVPTRRINWAQFGDVVNSFTGQVPSLSTVAEVDAAITSFQSNLKQALDASTHNTPQRRQANNLPIELHQSIRERRRAKKEYQRTLLPGHKRILRILSAQVRAELDILRNDRWQELLLSIADDNNTVWRISKNLRKKKIHYPPIHGQNGMAYSDQDKAEAFADSLELQCSPKYINADIEHIEQVHRTNRRYFNNTPDEDPIDPVTPGEVRAILKRSKPKKAPGQDGITN
ncbi:PREDICTED: RNA-directed DNA polymerase from mobile element jockey-like [Nicrophorus vespilloides]|uniref:RNA-directed DNA polymerase from mobile element jockey-like n=1 Tax=Nicrophorus vespilloides TaxID=110193 RepID=A0ABM1N2A4_NICVS|nr:PREDICTED: RNA-directed DNA polymerase from mobile element jockey-like [Nicrophorus vespilloides]